MENKQTEIDNVVAGFTAAAQVTTALVNTTTSTTNFGSQTYQGADCS